MNEKNIEFNKKAIAAFKLTKDLVMKEDVLVNNLIDIGTLGSVNDKEGVAGWSDLDILFVLKSDDIGNIDIQLIQKLKDIHSICSNSFHDFEISFLTHTMYDFENYVAYEYLKNYQFATIHYSNSPISFKNRLQKIIDDRNVSLEVQKRYAVYRARHLRFNLLRAIASWSGEDKPMAKLVIDRLIQSGIYITGLFGEYAQGKKERLDMIRRLITEQDIIKIFENATKLRFKWPEVQESECRDIINQGLSDLYKVEKFIINQYPKPVPEEYMNL